MSIPLRNINPQPVRTPGAARPNPLRKGQRRLRRDVHPGYERGEAGGGVPDDPRVGIPADRPDLEHVVVSGGAGPPAWAGRTRT